VILCTDGDFNVGRTSQGELVRLIERKAKTDVFLSVLGFGTGNLKDSTMELLADTGNGNYGYIDTLSEAQKVFVEEMSGTLLTIAKDVKIQVDFNPLQVQAYRLIGYENRLLRDEDFRNDAKDAGEIGAGHTVTALYELVPPGVEIDLPVVEPSEYRTGDIAPTGDADNLLTVRLRYKLPEADESTGFKHPVPNDVAEFAAASEDFRFAAAVAEFAMLLRGSQYRGSSSYADVLATAAESLGRDANGYRSEFVGLVVLARTLGREADAMEGDGAAVGQND
jgi:Ca-activated chloride channel family protein